LAIISPGDVWLKITRGEMNRPKALMDGLFQVEGDMNLLVKLGKLFQSPAKAEDKDFSLKGMKK
jgi:putative sterol carrier protein